jgi:hypothetical protein
VAPNSSNLCPIPATIRKSTISTVVDEATRWMKRPNARTMRDRPNQISSTYLPVTRMRIPLIALLIEREISDGRTKSPDCSGPYPITAWPYNGK